MTLSDETCCFVRQNSKNGYHVQKAAKADFIIWIENKQKNKGLELWLDIQFLCHYNTEPINRFDCALFKYITVYNYTHTSKQKFHLCWKQRIPFYSNDVIFMYGYFMILSYEITNKSHFVIQSCWAPYNCPHFDLTNHDGFIPLEHARTIDDLYSGHHYTVSNFNEEC